MRSPFAAFRRWLRADKAVWAEFRRLGPWITRFTIDGRDYGGWYDATGDARLDQFARAFPERRTILELGCLEGGHTIQLARLPGVTRVVALDGRDYNLAKARFIEARLGRGNVTYAQADLDAADLRPFGRFDAIFSVGLLYHLAEPWAHLVRCRQVSDGLFLWTHYIKDAKANVTRGGYRGWMAPEYGMADPLSGLSSRSFWPTLGELRRMLADAGFAEIEIIQDNQSHPHGPAVTLSARSADRDLPDGSRNR
jgi:hypothetical protein